MLSITQAPTFAPEAWSCRPAIGEGQSALHDEPGGDKPAPAVVRRLLTPRVGLGARG